MSATLDRTEVSTGVRVPSLAWRAAIAAGRALGLLRAWSRRNRACRLPDLNDHLLRDIGLSRIEVDGPSRLIAHRD
jgi:uncharacterized protein YjiS (DUF1127 family)